MKKYGFLLTAFVMGNVAAALQSTPADIITSLYENKSGHGIDESERKKIADVGGNATYGEITPRAVSKFVKKLKLKSSDVFVDLGSGIGKLVMQTCLESNATQCRGIELSDSRYGQAITAYNDLKKSHPDVAERISFTLGDIVTENIDNATVVFMCSTCFSDELMVKLAKKLKNLPKLEVVATLKKLPEDSGFELVGSDTYEMTWSAETSIYFYAPAGKSSRAIG
jgi:hypothetical protein